MNDEVYRVRFRVSEQAVYKHIPQMPSMNDEAYRLLFSIAEQALYTNTQQTISWWWYLRILRWVKMTILASFLMKQFYEPAYFVFYGLSPASSFALLRAEEAFRKLFSSTDEVMRSANA